MKKILLSIPENSTFHKPSVTTFRKMGWDVKNVDYRNIGVTKIAKNYLNLPRLAFSELTLRKRPSVKRVLNNGEILRVAKTWRPDIFLTFKGEVIQPETVSILKRLGITTINWYPDHLPDTNENIKFIEAFDCFIYWDKWRAKDYHKKGLTNVFYLPFCTIPSKLYAPKNKKYAINFIASWQPHREAKISPVSELGLKIWGSKTWSNTKLSRLYQGGPVMVPEMIKIIRTSKITLNIHVVEQMHSEGTNVRTFESTGAGGFLLVNKRKCLYELFNVGREIEVFENEEELIEKTKFYLKNNLSRERIARAGWERTKKEHTYLHRFQSLLKHIK